MNGDGTENGPEPRSLALCRSQASVVFGAFERRVTECKALSKQSCLVSVCVVLLTAGLARARMIDR